MTDAHAPSGVAAFDHGQSNRPDSRAAAGFGKYDLADTDRAVDFGIARDSKLPPLIHFLAMTTRRLSPLLGSWFVALSGGGISSLATRLPRLRRLAGAVARRELTPPKPIRLQIETTDVCNLRCVHCRREKFDDMDTLTMPLESFAQIIADIEPFYVNLAGFGEPFIDRWIFARLAMLHRRGIRTSLPTNGTYIRRDKREDLAAALPDILQLSIDGATKESFEAIRKGSDFGKIVGNYRAICALRAEGKARPNTIIRVLCALQRGNLHDYRAMYGLIKSLKGIDSFGLVRASFGGDHGSQMPTRGEVLLLHRELDAAIASAETEDERDFYRQWHSVSAGWLDKKSSHCGAGASRAPCAIPWYSAYIDAKGRVYPCCHLTGTRHMMGTLNKDGSGFDEIWRGARYRAFRSDLLSDRPNLEGCRACPRNDSRVMSLLEKMRILLPH